MAMQSMTVAIGGFVGLAIMLGVTVIILGSVNGSVECGTIKFANGTNNTAWQVSCLNAQASMQNSYNLLIVSLIVFAAIIILLVVRSL